MTSLSPAAQAVLSQAIYKGPELEKRVAAALRAAAHEMEFVEDYRKLLAIADELENLQ